MLDPLINHLAESDQNVVSKGLELFRYFIPSLVYFARTFLVSGSSIIFANQNRTKIKFSCHDYQYALSNGSYSNAALCII